MEFSKLKKGMFGYSKASVIEYVATLNNEFNKKVEDISNENAELLKKVEDLQNKLSASEEGATQMRDSIEKQNKELDIAAVMADVHKFADSLKEKAEEEYRLQIEANENALRYEKERVEIIRQNIEVINEEISRYLTDVKATLDSYNEVIKAQVETDSQE